MPEDVEWMPSTISAALDSLSCETTPRQQALLEARGRAGESV